MRWKRWIAAMLAYGFLAVETALMKAPPHPLEELSGFAGVDGQCVTPPATAVGINAPGTWTKGGSV